MPTYEASNLFGSLSNRLNKDFIVYLFSYLCLRVPEEPLFLQPHTHTAKKQHHVKIM